MSESNTKVTLTKLSTDRDTGEGMLKTGHWLKGTLLAAPVVGSPIEVARTVRAGRSAGEAATVECPGLFTSSPVERIEPQQDGSLVAITQNSHWLVEFAD